MSEDRQSMRAVAHALRSPLNGIIGCAELLYDEKLGPVSTEQKEYLGYILASAQELREAVDDLLARMQETRTE